MKRPLTRILLATSGTLLAGIGGAMLTRTTAFLAANGVEINASPSLMSELKAPSALLIVAGAIMLSGSARIRFARLGLNIGSVVYGSYGLARLAGIAMEGLPSGSLLIAMLVEFALAVLLLGLRLAEPATERSRSLQPRTA